MFDQTMLQKYGFVPMDHKEPRFFPVASGRIYDAEGKAIPNHQRIYREDSGDTLGIHTASYTMVPMERHALLVEDAIRKSTVPLGDMQVATDWAENGAKMFRQYLFPETAQMLRDAGQEHPVALRIVTWDSYDGTTSYKARAGAFDWVCANESVTGKMLSNVQFKHTGNIEDRVAKAADDMVNALSGFMQEMQRLAKWSGISVDPHTATGLLEALPQNNKGLNDQLTARWAREGGGSLFGFWSMLTSWSTHGIPAKTKSDRQKRVADLVEGRDWAMVEAR